jgi:hypothetical protein
MDVTNFMGGSVMFLNGRDFLVYRERHKDLLREAERNRLIRQVQAGRESRDRFHCRALIWLGRQLVAWGWRLQERYSAAATAPALRAANHSR